MIQLSKPVDFDAGASNINARGASSEAVKMRDAIKALTPLLRETAWEGEKATALVPSALRALDETGFFRVTLPKKFGGFAFGARDLLKSSPPRPMQTDRQAGAASLRPASEWSWPSARKRSMR